MQRIDHAEHSRVGADAEGQRQHRDDGEPGVALKSAPAVANILRDFFEPARAARVAADLLDLIEAAELQPGAAAGFVVAEALREAVRDQAIEVIAELGVELVLESIPPEQPCEPVHDPSLSDVLRIAPTACVRRRQLCASAAMCARPFAVSL